MAYTRIATDAHQMGGVPYQRRLRISVGAVIGLVAEGHSTEQILELYPDLCADNVREAVLFAAEVVRERGLPLLQADEEFLGND